MELQGHRGFGILAPFNSLRAFYLAAKLGLTSVEFDIRLLKDKTLVVTHGPELGSGNIENLTWTEVKDLVTDELDFNEDINEGIFKDTFKAKNTLDIAPALLSWNKNLSSSILTEPQTIPKFQNVCEFCVENGLIMNIELKTTENGQVLLDCLLPILDKLDPEAKYSRISSFNIEILWKVQKLRPKIPVGALFNKGLSKSENKTEREKTPCDFVQNLRPHMDSANLCAETVTKEEIACAKKANVKVLAWFPGVPDGPEDLNKFRELEELGVDVLCTNRPDIAIMDYKK